MAAAAAVQCAKSRSVAFGLASGGLGTFLFDLLSAQERSRGRAHKPVAV